MCVKLQLLQFILFSVILSQVPASPKFSAQSLKPWQKNIQEYTRKKETRQKNDNQADYFKRKPLKK